MKTDVVEIFQTIRAALQPYATLGFANRINSDEVYDLWSDKNIKSGLGEPGSQIERIETFFASVTIESNVVSFKYAGNQGIQAVEKHLAELDEVVMKQIEDELSATYKFFKEQEWV